jgi:hypothetical protein
MDRVALGHVFLPVLSISPVIIIPPVLQTHLHLHVALNQKEKRAKPGNLPYKQCSFRYWGVIVFKNLKSPIRAGFVVDKVTPGQVFFLCA